ncbi:MAG: HDIG domain-containing protein [Desulfobacteraceae bacterium]|nr:HDIG domain-containing protein [Desulfobacteraceae bacterium]
MTLANTITAIIDEYYPPASPAREVLLRHSEMVARKALQTARKVSHLHPDLEFIEQAAMLHDIGIFYARAPEIGCFGKYPYVCHGYLGRILVEGKGLSRHALVCERHVGVGLTLEEIRKQDLPLPLRDMVPVSLEERIVCYADKFFSKKPGKDQEEWPVEMVLKSLEKYGLQKVARFTEWLALFGETGW